MSEKCGEYDKAMTYLIWVCCAPRKGKLDFTVPRLVVFLFDDLLLPFKTRPWSGPHSTSLENPSSTSAMTMSIYGEERERKQFVAAVKDGYVLCE